MSSLEIPLIHQAVLPDTPLYCFVFPNPFDTHPENSEFLAAELLVAKARKELLRAFKLEEQDTKAQKMLAALESVEWLSGSSKATVTNKVFIETALAALKWKFSYWGFGIKLVLSRDRDEVFMHVYTKEEWLRKAAVNERYRLQLRSQESAQEVSKFPFKAVTPYAPLESTDSELYKHYDQNDNEVAKGGSLFTSNDKIRLFLGFVKNKLDLNSMKDSKLLLHHYCLHDKAKLSYFKSEWGRLGALVKAQPIDEIAKYFGEKVAFYFAWMKTYNSFMLYAGVIGLAIFILDLVVEQNPYEVSSIQILTVCFAVFMSLWASMFDQKWVQKESELSWKYGTTHFHKVEEQRGEFQGVYEKDEITGKIKKQRESSFLYRLRKTISYTVAVLFVCLVLAAVAAIFFYRSIVKHTSYGPLLCGVINAVQIRIMNILYGMIAQKMNDWENHETETQYNDNLAVKLFLFKFVNSYASLFYIAFFKGDIEGCKNDNCFSELSLQLGSIFIVNLVLNVVELGLPWVKQQLEVRKEKKKIQKMTQEDPSIREHMGEVEEQAKCEDYESPFDDYMEMAIQFGYVLLFGAAFPLVPFLALIETTLEVRVDAWKLCNLTKRPFPYKAENIGVWKQILLTVSYFGAITNAGLIIFTSGIFDFCDTLTQWIIFIALEHILVLGKFVISVVIKDVPEVVEDGLKWSERIVKERVYKVFSKSEDQTSQKLSFGKEFLLKPEEIQYIE